MDYPTPRPGGWRIFVWFGLFFFLFDISFARFTFWALPNESAWSEHPFYNFEYRAREALATVPVAADSYRVVVAGSSLALYSIHAPEFKATLRPHLNGREVDLRVLSHQGMSTMHLAAYADRILATRPDVVVIPLGTVDFRLERPIMLGIDGLDSPDPAVRESLLAASLRYTVSKPEFRMLAPLGWLREYGYDLDLNQISAALLATGIAVYRYRPMIRAPIATLLDNRFSRGRSYHEYAGVPVGGGGITHRGWTARAFELEMTARLLADGLLFQAPDELFAAAAPGRPSLRISAVADEFQYGTRVLELKPGWQTLSFENESGETRLRPGDRLRFELSHTSESAADADQRGVRLSRNAGREIEELRDLSREPRREDRLYRAYSDVRYRESFARRILRFDRAGSEYLEALKQARQIWAQRPFEPDLPGFRAFESFRKRLAEAGVRLLIVNNPENPISLEWYADSAWYQEYLRYLATSPGSSQRYDFFDASRLLKMQMFYDYHHLSYYGAEAYSRAVALRLAELLKSENTPGS